jgi:hypothetical protein
MNAREKEYSELFAELGCYVFEANLLLHGRRGTGHCTDLPPSAAEALTRLLEMCGPDFPVVRPPQTMTKLKSVHTAFVRFVRELKATPVRRRQRRL